MTVSVSSTSGSDPVGGDDRIAIRDLSERAWKNYRLLSKASQQLEPTCNQLLSIIGSLNLIEDHARKGEVADEHSITLKDLMSWIQRTLLELESALDNLKSNSSPEGFTSISEKRLDPTGRLSGFVERLQSDRQKNIGNILGEVHEAALSQSAGLDISDLLSIETELENRGIPRDVIEEEFFFINNWLEERDVEYVEEDEPLPDYTPRTNPAPIAEKVQTLNEVTRNLSLADPGEQAGMSSTADPPPYTFDSGSDQAMDDSEFLLVIQKAIEIEARHRLIQNEQDPNLTPQPIFWLPMSVRELYEDDDQVIRMMDGDSFSAMAYETAPRCLNEIQRIRTSLGATFGGKRGRPGNDILDKAFATLETLTSALGKFNRLRNPQIGSEHFSDLDIFEIEFSVVQDMSKDEQLELPMEFQRAKKSYYQILTYIMGVLQEMSTVFPGSTHVTSSADLIERSWERRKMDIRSAWVEKHLAAWYELDDTVLSCREIHHSQPAISHQALMGLENWKRAETILSGSDRRDTIEFSLMSAANLPKPAVSLRTHPSAYAKVILYGPSRWGGFRRAFELKTHVCQKTSDPDWRYKIPIEVPVNSKAIDVEIYDHVAGIDKQICSARFPFSYIPGVEANFLDRSLVYGYDEDVEAPLQVIGKGKETVTPVVRMHFKWVGRQGQVEALGYPLRAPGKLFRRDNNTPIPLSSEEKAVIKFMNAKKQGASGSSAR